MCNEIRLLDDNVDYQSLKPLGWDLIINTVPYHVYRIDGYYHSLGGRGDNQFYCCPRNEVPTKENLIQYSNRFGPVKWGIICQEQIRIKCKWNETSTRPHVECYITRNDKRFYDITAGSFEFAMSTAYSTLIKLQEHPIDFIDINWKENLINRKIWWRSVPCIVKSIVNEQGCIIVEREDKKVFEAPMEFRDDDDHDEYETTVKLDFLDPHIWWWRDVK